MLASAASPPTAQPTPDPVLVGVCDFPGAYPFPPIGYGGIERWLWAVAIGARKAGAEVHLLGPQWRAELAADWTIRPTRLEDLTPGKRQARELRAAGYDLLAVGHEYPSLPRGEQCGRRSGQRWLLSSTGRTSSTVQTLSMVSGRGSTATAKRCAAATPYTGRFQN